MDSFTAEERRKAFLSAFDLVEQGHLTLPPPGDQVNMHCHSFFGYNVYFYSPTKIAWLAARAGLAAAQIVDFDVLDGMDEFRRAGDRLNLRACAGFETRTYLPQFAGAVTNSPGEPGIAYHMGVGFPSSDLSERPRSFLRRLRRIAADRNRDLIARVNEYLDPVTLDYERDVLPLTPAGNATERHICLAYARRGAEVFSRSPDLHAFWRDKLGVEVADDDLPDSFALQSALRSKTMKRGGVGYVPPGAETFPEMSETCRFTLEAGGIPTHCWLDGTSDGEERLDELLGTVVELGVRAVNVIVDRNYGRCEPQVKIRNLFRLAEVARERDLILVAGTEMNSPGQQLVDDMAAKELAPLLPAFLEGALIVYAHSVMQRRAGLGYGSAWAAEHFPDWRARNEFYKAMGSRLRPDCEQVLDELDAESMPDPVLRRLGG